jgi:hypothetical protein
MQTDAARPATKIEIAIPGLGPVELQKSHNGEVVVSVEEFPQGKLTGQAKQFSILHCRLYYTELSRNVQ